MAKLRDVRNVLGCAEHSEALWSKRYLLMAHSLYVLLREKYVNRSVGLLDQTSRFTKDTTCGEWDLS